MNVTFLGTGTSSGVPVIACDCKVCRSDKSEDKRLRTSILLEHNDYTMIVDMTPDFRQQALKKVITSLDAVLLTHDHADHIFGLDDIRQLSRDKTIPVYTNSFTKNAILKRFDYIFMDTQKGGGKPKISLSVLENDEITLGPFRIREIPVYHGDLKISSYRINNLVYITDCSRIPEESVQYLKGADTLIINTLREKKHSTHYSHQETIDAIKMLNPKKAYTIHMTHSHSHAELIQIFKDTAEPAFDGLIINIPD